MLHRFSFASTLGTAAGIERGKKLIQKQKNKIRKGEKTNELY